MCPHIIPTRVPFPGGLARDWDGEAEGWRRIFVIDEKKGDAKGTFTNNRIAHEKKDLQLTSLSLMRKSRFSSYFDA